MMAIRTRPGRQAMAQRRAAPSAAGLACLLALAGCATPEARHEVLSFFFAGVPEPGTVQEVQARPMSPQERMRAMRDARRRAAFKQPTTFAHGPYASDLCYGCHQGARPGATRGSLQVGPNFVRPRAKLCLTCHVDMGGERAQADGFAVHAPIAEGDCLACHHPHGTQRQYMLKAEDNIALCATCHAKGMSAGAPVAAVHAEDMRRDCMECHNPHVGKTALLLRDDFDEWQRYDTGG